MTIEHVDDEKFLNEVSRILKPGGILLLSTVMKRNHAWYYLKNSNGESVLELSHMREYKSPEELTTKINNHGFKVILLETLKIKFSFLDFILVRLVKLFKSKFFSEMAAKDFMVKLRKISKLPIPGYFAIELIAKKEHNLNNFT